MLTYSDTLQHEVQQLQQCWVYTVHEYVAHLNDSSTKVQILAAEKLHCNRRCNSCNRGHEDVNELGDLGESGDPQRTESAFIGARSEVYLLYEYTSTNTDS